MKKFYLVICLLCSVGVVSAQTTATFEAETGGSTTFTDNGKTFNVTSQAQGPFSVQAAYPNSGWGGTSADDKFIDNYGNTALDTPVQFTISTADASAFTLKNLYLFLAAYNKDLNVTGSVTITGKLGTVTRFTATSSSGFNSALGTNNGFTFVNMSTFGGQNNSNKFIDKFIITTTGSIAYVALDAMTWQIAVCPTINTSGTQSNVTCNGGSNGFALVTASGGVAPYTYSWSPSGGSAASTSGRAAGTYTVTVKDANGCTATRVFTITQPMALTSTGAKTDVSCFGGSDGTATVNVSGGTPGYSYNWNPGNPPGDGTATVTGLTPGVYSVTITDANGCTTSRNFTISQPASSLSGSTVITNASCGGGSDGAVDLIPSGGTGPYAYDWGGGITTEDRVALTPGTYSVTITDARGCTAFVNATVGGPLATISGTTSITNVSCNGGSNGAIDLTPSGGTPPFTYDWGSGITTQDRVGIPAGNYTVIITDANGCSGTVTATVTQSAASISGTTMVTNVICFGSSTGSINLTPSGGVGPYTYNWGGGITTKDRSGLSAGSYSVTITDANGCSGTVAVTITQPAASLSATTAITAVSCSGGANGAVNLTPVGGTAPYSYTWADGITTEDRTGLSAGTYPVTITDANGCTVTIPIGVTEPAPVSANKAIVSVKCFGGSDGVINITPTGGTPPYTFNWGGGITTEDRTGLPAGTYAVTITDSKGCTGTINAIVPQPASALSANMAVTNPSCFGGSNGAINLTPSGGTPPYSFNWGGGITTEDRTGLSAGSYSVLITDANGCVAGIPVTVTQPFSVTGSTVVTDVSCIGGTDGAINLVPSGGTGPYTYNWGGGITTEDRTGLSAGNYSVVITDVNGCTGIVPVTVTQPLSPVSGTTVVTNVTCNGGSNGAINLTPSGGTGPYTYNWGGGITTEDRTGLSAGSYTVVITDAKGCTGTLTVIISQPATIISGSTIITNATCVGASNGSIDLTPSGGVPPYTYDWGSSLTTQDRINLPAGTYTVVITDANGCTGTVTATISEPATPISGSTVVTNVSCNGGANGSINLTPSGGTGPYTYNWGGGITTEDMTGLTAGTYLVQITDAGGCTGVISATVNEPALLSVTPSQTNVMCNGTATGSAAVAVTGGTGPYTYMWSPSGGASATASGLFAGTYSVTVSDANNCTTSQSFTITEPAPLSATTSQTNATCAVPGQASVVVTGGTPGYTYLWSPSGNTSSTAANLPAGNHSVVITDANGCTINKNFVITGTNTLSTTGTQTNVSCNGGSNGSATVAVTGGSGSYTYSWAPSGGVGATATGLTAGTYTVTINDAGGCSTTHIFNITQPPVLTATASAQTNVSCNGGSNGSATVAITGGSGPYTYAWSPMGGTGATATGLSAGTYTVTVTDGNNCTASKSFTITQPTALVASALAQTNVSCNGVSNGSATVAVTGGTGSYTYSWSPMGGTGATATGLTAGTYTVTVTDANGCTATKSFIITQPAALVASASAQTNVFCNGGSNASATVAVTGGSGSYTYSWAPSGGVGATATGLTAGTYTVTINDAGGCSTTHIFNITQPPVLTATASAQTNVSCNGGSNGSATVAITGGSGPYTYAWSPMGGTGATATGLSAGTYTVTVTDANNCTASKSFTITQPAPLTATTSQINATCTVSGQAAVNVSGGTPGYTYLWSPSGDTTSTAANLSAGNHSVVITDANGCTLIKNFTISDTNTLAVTGTKINVSCNGGSNGSATVTPTGGAGPYTYSWSPTGGIAATATGLTPGIHTVTVTDANGCTATQSFTISQPAALVASASAQTNVSCNGGSNGSVTVAVTGGTGPYTYSWAPSGGTAATATGLVAGTYTVTVTDTNNCTTTQSFTITEPAPLSATTSQINPTCAIPGQAAVNVIGGTPGYGYLWSPSGQTSSTATNLPPGNHTVVITDANGCTLTKNFTITGTNTVTTTGSQTNLTCNGASNGTATVAVTGGTGTYAYSWAPSGGTAATATGLSAGVYIVTVTDTNGCTATQSFTITEPAAIVTSSSAQLNVSCNGGSNGSATVTVTGGTGTYTYSWAPSGGTTATANGLSAGTYTVIVTDTNGCTATQSFTITQPAALAISASSQTNVSCNSGSNGSATVTVTGGAGSYSYSWTPSGGTAATANGLSAGTYTVTVTDANGCITAKSFTITEPPMLAATVTSATASCSGAASGIATVAVTGGTGPYTYLWTPSGGTGATATGLTAGIYTVTVTDANNCSVTGSVNVVSAPDVSVPVADVSALPAITKYCSVLATDIPIPTATDNCSGTIMATTTDPLVYTSEGSYMITWSYNDGNGNITTQNQIINVLASPLELITFNDANFVYNTEFQTITVQNLPAGAQAVYNIFPLTGTGNGAINAGTYTVTATITPGADAAYCSPVTLTATLTIDKAPQVIVFEPLPVKHLETDPDFQLDAYATSGLPVYYTTFIAPELPADITSGGFVNMLTPGQVLILAHQDGNENYLPATPVQQVLTIESNNASIINITVGTEYFVNPSEDIYYLVDCENTSTEVVVNVVAAAGANVVPGHQFTIATPHPGIYTQQITVTSQDGTVTNTYTIVVEKTFGFFTIVEQKFDNVLLVNNNPATNGGYNFVAYEWFRNDESIGIGQYYSAGNDIQDLLDTTAEYYVRVTTAEGEVYETCRTSIRLEHDYTSRLYPNPAQAGKFVTVEADFPAEELRNMQISIYSITGSLVTRVKSSEAVTQVQLPPTMQDAVYMVVLETPNIQKTLKVVIHK